jgi:segregation and condensation protein A
VAYRVQLPVFSGPMDLLLHLVRQQEVDVREIAVARILEDYLKHLEVLRELDLHDIGDFVVMASTLMEIKSRELLPEEAIEIEQELDPRDDLIRRLLEYKRYRDLARELEGRADRRSRQSPLVLPMPPQLADPEDENLLDLGEIQVWDLTSAFARLLEEIGQQSTMTVDIDTRDIGFYTRRLLERFRRQRELEFAAVFERSEGRSALIGTLIALLEMMKQGCVRAQQEVCFGAIHLVFEGDPSLTAEQILEGIAAQPRGEQSPGEQPSGELPPAETDAETESST